MLNNTLDTSKHPNADKLSILHTKEHEMRCDVACLKKAKDSANLKTEYQLLLEQKRNGFCKAKPLKKQQIDHNKLAFEKSQRDQKAYGVQRYITKTLRHLSKSVQ